MWSLEQLSQIIIDRIEVLVYYNASNEQFTLESSLVCRDISLELPLITLNLSELEYFDENDFFNTVIDYCTTELQDNCTCDADVEFCDKIEKNLEQAEWFPEFLDFEFIDKKVLPIIPFHASVNVSILKHSNFRVDVSLTFKDLRDEIFSFENKSLQLAFDEDEALCIIDTSNNQLMTEIKFTNNIIEQVKAHISSFLGYNQVLCDVLLYNLEKNIDIVYKDFILVEEDKGLILALRFLGNPKNALSADKNLEHSEYLFVLNVTELENSLEVNVYIPRCNYKPTYVLDTTNIMLETTDAYANSIINFVMFKLTKDKFLAEKIEEFNEINAKCKVSALPEFTELFWVRNEDDISWVLISKNFNFPHSVDENILFSDYNIIFEDLAEKFTNNLIQLRETLNLTIPDYVEFLDFEESYFKQLKSSLPNSKDRRKTSILRLSTSFENLESNTNFTETPSNKKGFKNK